jgi:hypothetical protein
MDSMTTTLLTHPYQLLMAATLLTHLGRALVAALIEARRHQPTLAREQQAA